MSNQPKVIIKVFFMEITVKQRKWTIIFLLCLYVAQLIAVACTVSILMKYLLDETSNLPNENILFWLYIIILALDFAVVVAYSVNAARIFSETYVFTDDKLIVKRGQTIKAEIKYCDIEKVRIRNTLNSLNMYYLKQSADGCNQWKTKRFYGDFEPKELDKIKEKLTAFNAENGESIKMI